MKKSLIKRKTSAITRDIVRGVCGLESPVSLFKSLELETRSKYVRKRQLPYGLKPVPEHREDGTLTPNSLI